MSIVSAKNLIYRAIVTRSINENNGSRTLQICDSANPPLLREPRILVSQNMGDLIDLILQHTHDKIFMSISQYSALTGMPAQTIRNQMNKKTWKIPRRKEGSRVYMSVTDVACHLARDPDFLSRRRRRGRPRNQTSPPRYRDDLSQGS